MFKPIIVERVIFSLINKGRIRKSNFVKNGDESVYLDESGKRLFVEEFEEKLNVKITEKNKNITYLQLVENEIRLYQNHILLGEQYKPYKYY